MTMADPHLIPLKPALYADFPCPSCGATAIEARGTVFPGVHVLGDYRCDACGLEFLRDLPVGFAVQHPVAIGRADGRLFNPSGAEPWLHGPLLQAYRAPSNAPVTVERIVRRTARRVVVLNTLDFLYGHVLLKLFNAQAYLDRYPDRGLVIILPRMYAWLAPPEAAEVWLVDLRLGQAHGWYTRFNAWVQERLAAYDEVDLARGYAHPEQAGLDIARFAGIPAFDPARFDALPPHITFVARQDRLWFASDLGELCHRALNKLGLKGLGRWYVRRQDRLMRRTMRAVRRVEPRATFTVVGLARPGGYGTLARDLRTERMDEATERAWCQAYAQSHVVVGVHGSNMLLPTAFAAACVEVLPDDRIGNIVQDIFVRYPDRMQLFAYRFVDERARPGQVAHHVLGILRHYSAFHRNMCVHTV